MDPATIGRAGWTILHNMVLHPRVTNSQIEFFATGVYPCGMCRKDIDPILRNVMHNTTTRFAPVERAMKMIEVHDRVNAKLGKPLMGERILRDGDGSNFIIDKEGLHRAYKVMRTAYESASASESGNGNNVDHQKGPYSIVSPGIAREFFNIVIEGILSDNPFSAPSVLPFGFAPDTIPEWREIVSMRHKDRATETTSTTTVDGDHLRRFTSLTARHMPKRRGRGCGCSATYGS
jgi:hypothetical protein